jgi:hypothetical protein
MTDMLMPRPATGEDTREPATPLPTRRPRLRVLEPSSLVPTYVGVGVIALGFALIAIGWAKVAGLDNVALQLPYIVSAGITGLGLVMCGLITVNIAAKRQDAAERARQMERLTSVMAELKETLETATGHVQDR